MFLLAIVLVYPAQLAKVSRGLGDFEYKADGLSPGSAGFPWATPNSWMVCVMQKSTKKTYKNGWSMG